MLLGFFLGKIGSGGPKLSLVRCHNLLIPKVLFFSSYILIFLDLMVQGTKIVTTFTLFFHTSAPLSSKTTQKCSKTPESPIPILRLWCSLSSSNDHLQCPERLKSKVLTKPYDVWNISIKKNQVFGPSTRC